MAKCKSCDAEITWAEHHISGRPMPLGAVQPTASLANNLRGVFAVVKGVARPATEDDVRLHRDLFRSHFATCPQAKEWRRGEG